MTDRLREMLQSPLFRRGIIGLYVTALTVTIGVYIGVSMLEVQTAAFFRGDNTLEKGRTNGIRGVILNARTGQFRREIDVEFFLAESSDDKKRRKLGTLGTASPGRTGVVHSSLTVPSGVEPGTYRLGVRATGPEIERYTATTEVEVTPPSEETDRWLEAVSRLSNEERKERFSGDPVRETSGALAIEILPLDAEIPRGLPGTIYLVTYDAETGEPVPATVTFEEVEGIGQWGGQAEAPSKVRTDHLGLAEMSVEAAGGQKWTLSAEEMTDSEEAESRQGRATIDLHTVASKMTLTLDRPYVGRDGEVTGHIHSLFRSGAIFVDLYRSDQWLTAAAAPVGRGRRAQFTLPVPTIEGASPWLYRIQTARGVYGTGNAWDIERVVAPASSGKSGMRETLGRLVTLVADHRDEHPYFQHLADAERIAKVTAARTDLTEWTSAMLRALPRHYARPETLFNTQKGDRRALKAWIERFQADLMVPIVVALVGGLAFLLYIAIAGWRRKREHERHLRQIDDDLAAEAAESGDAPGEEDAQVESGTGGDILAWLLAVVALAVLAMFGLGLVLLLSYL